MKRKSRRKKKGERELAAAAEGRKGRGLGFEERLWCWIYRRVKWRGGMVEEATARVRADSDVRACRETRTTAAKGYGPGGLVRERRWAEGGGR